MKERFSKAVREDAGLRESFNALTRKTFGFDFEDWYDAGCWGDLYVPHVLTDGDRVVSNVSVNLMRFDVGGVQKNYVQLGTVMTDPEYRGRGLNRRLMEQVLAEYRGKADGIYLFGNDRVLTYYPKFGFEACKEYEYYLPIDPAEDAELYEIERVMPSRRLYDWITGCSGEQNPNDGLYMSHNLGLYQFWLAAEFRESVYHLPENETYVVAEVTGDRLYIHQIFGKQRVELKRLAKAFGEKVSEVVLGYTPASKEQLLVREHKEEDTTLFILGDDLKRMQREKMMFPVLSHA